MEKFKNVENLHQILKNFDGWVKKKHFLYMSSKESRFTSINILTNVKKKINSIVWKDL